MMDVKVLEKLLLVSGVVLCVTVYWKFSSNPSLSENTSRADTLIVSDPEEKNLEEKTTDSESLENQDVEVLIQDENSFIDEDVYVVKKGDSFLSILETKNIPNKFSIRIHQQPECTLVERFKDSSIDSITFLRQRKKYVYH